MNNLHLKLFPLQLLGIPRHAIVFLGFHSKLVTAQIVEEAYLKWVFIFSLWAAASELKSNPFGIFTPFASQSYFGACPAGRKEISSGLIWRFFFSGCRTESPLTRPSGPQVQWGKRAARELFLSNHMLQRATEKCRHRLSSSSSLSSPRGGRRCEMSAVLVQVALRMKGYAVWQKKDCSKESCTEEMIFHLSWRSFLLYGNFYCSCSFFSRAVSS